MHHVLLLSTHACLQLLADSLTAAVLQAAQKVYHVALKRCPGSAAMHELYAVFLQQHAEALTVQLTKLEQQQQAARAAGKTEAAKQERKQLRTKQKSVVQQLTEAATLLEAVCSEAAQQGCASEQVLLAWPAAALRAGRAQAVLQAARSACQALPASASVWEQRLKLEGQRLSLQVCVSVRSSLPVLMMPRGPPVGRAAVCRCCCAVASTHVCATAISQRSPLAALTTGDQLVVVACRWIRLHTAQSQHQPHRMPYLSAQPQAAAMTMRSGRLLRPCLRQLPAAWPSRSLLGWLSRHSLLCPVLPATASGSWRCSSPASWGTLASLGPGLSAAL